MNSVFHIYLFCKNSEKAFLPDTTVHCHCPALLEYVVRQEKKQQILHRICLLRKPDQYFPECSKE